MADYIYVENINTQLFQYLRFGENEKFKSMLNNKKELIRTYDIIGTLLHYAAYCGNAEIAQHLIELGIDIDRKGRDGKTALALAISKSRCATTIKVLLDAGANIDDDFGNSPLKTIFAIDDTMTDILRLFRKKVRAEAATIEEAVRRLTDAGCTLYHAAFFDDFELMESMSNEIDVNFKSKSGGGKSALYAAVELNDLKLAEWLIEIGADVNAKDGYHVSVLCSADEKTKWHHGSNKALIQLLLEEGANPNASFYNRVDSPLLLLVILRILVNNVDVTYLTEYVELLLEHGAIPRNSVHTDYTIFDHALMDKSLRMARSLIAQLALLKKRGTSIDESVVRCNGRENQLKLDKLVDYRKLCERILGVVMFGTLTLFQLLTDSDSRMRKYARNEMFVVKIKEVCLEKKMDKLYPYYYKMLMKRVNKAVDLLELENIAIPIVCRLMNCNENECYIAARTIVSYLNAAAFEKSYKSEM